MNYLFIKVYLHKHNFIIKVACKLGSFARHIKEKGNSNSNLKILY